MADKNSVIASFERLVIASFTQKLLEHFALDDKPTFISSNDRWRLKDDIDKQRNKTFKLPQLYVVLRSIRINTESYNPSNLARMGLYAKNQGSNLATNYKFLPVIYQFEILYITQDFYEILDFSKRFLFAMYEKEKLSFTINYDNEPVDCTVQVASAIEVPEKDNSLDSQNLYELVSTMEVFSYVATSINDAQDIPMIKKTAINGDSNQVTLRVTTSVNGVLDTPTS